MSGGDDELRLFFAVAPDDVARARIADAAAVLPLPPDARLTPAANYHLTLAFIGNVPARLLPVLLGIGNSQRARAFVLRFDAYEYWPKPAVVIAAARVVPDELQQLWQGLHAALSPHGWALAPKRLRPHVTIAKKVTQAPVLQALSGFDWRVSEICLMRSDTVAKQSTYTVVDTWPLLDNAEKA